MALLSPGRSSMRVAGTKKESFYECPGDMLYFDAVHVYHRSGLASARTLKIAFFVKLTGSAPVTIDLIGDDGGSSRSSKMDKPVKQEQAKKEPKVKEEELEGEEEEPAAVVAGPPKKQFVSSELKPPSSASPSVQGGAAAPLAAATDKNPSKEDADESKEDAEPSQETEVVAVAPPQETEEEKHESARDPPASPASGEVVGDAAHPRHGRRPGYLVHCGRRSSGILGRRRGCSAGGAGGGAGGAAGGRGKQHEVGCLPREVCDLFRRRRRR